MKAIEKLCKRITKEENGCWTFRGKIRINNTMCKAHKVLYIVAYGEVPDGYTLKRTCENKYCCNPRHRILKAQRKLSQEEITEILAMKETGEKQTTIAKRFGVSQSRVSRILWEHASNYD